MARGIPNRNPSGKEARGSKSPLRRAPRNTDFATMTRPEWRISDGLVPYHEALADDGGAGRRHPRRPGRRARLAARASAALHRRDQRQAGTTCCARCAFPSMPRGAAGSTPITGRASAWSTRCSTSPPPPGRAALRLRARGVGDPRPRPLQRHGRAPRRPGRRLGGAPDARPGRRQPREDKIAAIGVRLRHWVSFHGTGDQRRARPVALRAASCPAASAATA